MIRRARVLLPVLWAAPLAAAAQAAPPLLDLSLEELAQVPVTSVTGRPTPVRQAAASVFVIGREDLRRSGATSLPEALRLAPNLQVARLNATQWAISARGFNNAIGNKLLVLVDGRTVYSPLYGGVFWDAQLVLLEDVERIEVISGPGATLWGANAVNGVINVITRPAGETTGSLAVAQGGEDGWQVSARHGARWGGRGAWRAWVQHDVRDATDRLDGTVRDDGTRRSAAGLRADWVGTADHLMVEGGLVRGGDDTPTNLAPRLSGAHLLARWRHRDEDGGNWQLQAYVDESRREEPVLFHDRTRLADLEFNHAPAAFGRHQLLWGLGLRAADSVTEPTAFVAFDPVRRRQRWASAFVQDEMALAERWHLTAGLKLERNVFAGTEVLPTVRLRHDLSDRHTLWAGWSRAVRAPARLDRDFHFPARPPYLIEGGPDFRSEVAKVTELGWRGQVAAVNGSLTAFHADYDRLRAGRDAPTRIENLAWGRVWGVEGWGSVEVRAGWRLSAGFVELRKSLRTDPASPPSSVPNLGNDPEHQWMLRSQASLSPAVEFDLTLRHVSALPQPAVPAYTVADLRLAWQARPGLELSLIGQDLGRPAHAEFNPADASRFGPRAWLRLQWALP